MTTKEYIEVLKSVLTVQIGYRQDHPKYDESEFLQGEESGLLIALAKIEASEFLID